MRIVSRYLIFSIRAGAYAANLYFLSFIDVYLVPFVPSALVRNIIYLLYSVFVYEIAGKIVRIAYKPGFILEGESTGDITGKPVLDEIDYTYRVLTEKMIYVSTIYYGFSMLASIPFQVFRPVETGWEILGLGLLGGFLSVMNFFGVVVLASSGVSFSPKMIPMYILSLCFMIPLMGYLVYTFFWAFM